MIYQISQEDDGFDLPQRDSLDFDALAGDDDEEAGNKPPAYDPGLRKDTSTNNNNSNGGYLRADLKNTETLPAPQPQRPQQARRDLDGDGETMFAVGDDEDEESFVGRGQKEGRKDGGIDGFSDSEEEGLVGGSGRR
jgi:hypothetical protein